MKTYRPIPRGSVKNSLYLEMQDSTTGLPKTGFAYNTAGIKFYYTKKRVAAVAVTPATLAAVTTAWTSGGVKEIDATNAAGLVRFDIPDAAFTDDGVSDEVIISVVATGYAPVNVRVPLTDKQDVWVSPGTTRANS